MGGYEDFKKERICGVVSTFDSNLVPDEMKNKWCSRNGVPLIRIWEKDINEHPEDVLTFLKEKLGLLKEKKARDDKFNKRH